MKILDKYLFSLIAKSSILSLIFLMLIFSLIKFIDELDEIGGVSYSISTAAEYVVFLIPSILNNFIVLSIMIGVVFSLGGLNSNNEIQIFQCGKYSPRQIILRIIKFSSFICILMIALFELISPYSSDLAFRLKNTAQGNVISDENKSTWIRRDGNYIFFNKKKNNPTEVLVFQIDNINLKSAIMTNNFKFSEDIMYFLDQDKVNIDEDKQLKLINKNVSEENFSIELEEEQLNIFPDNIKTISIFEIFNTISLGYQNENKISEYYNELVSRLIRPIILVGLILIAAPFLFDVNRNTSVSFRVFLAVSLGLITNLLIKIVSTAALKFDHLSIIGPIMPGVILITIGLFFSRKTLMY